MCAVHAPRSTLRRDEAAAPSLYNHGVWSANGGRRLRPEAVLRLAQELLHKIDAFMRHSWSGWKAERLLPVQNLLPCDMPLIFQRMRQEYKKYHGIYGIDRAGQEISGLVRQTSDGCATHRVANEWWEAGTTWVVSNEEGGVGKPTAAYP